MEQASIKTYLRDIKKFAVNYKKAHLIHFIVGMSLFLFLLIATFCDFNEFSKYFVMSFQQLGLFVYANIFVVICLLLCYFILLYFLIFVLISIFRKDRTKFLICDIFVTFAAIVVAILFVHGTEDLNVLNMFKIALNCFSAGKIGYGIRYLIMFFMIILTMIMLFVYSLDRLIYRERKIKVFLSVQEFPLGTRFWKPDEANEPQLYDFSYHKTANFVRVMSDVKYVDEELLNHEVHKLMIKVNETTLLYNPKFFVKIKYGFKVYEKELILNKDFSVGVQNGYLYVKEIAKDVLA